MKVTFIEELEARIAFTYKSVCPKCHGHKYVIHHQLKPETPLGWWIECSNCGFITKEYTSREVALMCWRGK